MPDIAPANSPSRTRIILDTDIGDDIDDALALALIVRSPELELLGVTTVFGNVAARARQARTVLAVAGVRGIPVAAGCGATMASRPMRDHTWKAYIEGTLPNQDATCLPESQLEPLDRRHGVDFLIETIMAGDGDIVPVTIGAMTNLAMALVKEPRIAAKIPRIVAMAAEFRRPQWEWNIRCDPEAAHIVFSSGIRIDVTPWWIGDVAQFTPADEQRLRAATSPLARNLSAAIDRWRGVGNGVPRLYDPMAVATMVRPDLCTWVEGTVAVELQGSDRSYSMTTMTNGAGPHRVAWDVDRTRAMEFWLDRVAGPATAIARAGSR